jgi:hypothetical protein
MVLVSLLTQPVWAGHNQSHRGQQCQHCGDVRMTQSLAQGVTSYALECYELDPWVSGEALDQVPTQLFGFWMWKFGSASASCAQYVTAGYEHFRTTYVDEAAAALLGVELPNDAGQPYLILPEWVVASLQRAGSDVTALLTARGVPTPVAATGTAQVKELGSTTRRRMQLTIPQSWDMDRRFVQLLLKARKHRATAPTPAVQQITTQTSTLPAWGTRSSLLSQGDTLSASTLPTGSLPAMASIQGLLDDRLATMERRISALEARLAEGSGQSLNLDDQRYESVFLEVQASVDNRLQVMINGRPAVGYDAQVRMHLDPLLKAGALNAITFTFEQPIPGAYVHLVAKAPESPDWTEVLRFSPRREQLEKEVKVTFVGGKER